MTGASAPPSAEAAPAAPVPMDRIRLTRAQLRSLAAGYGEPEVIRALSAGQYSRRLLLIRAVVDRARTARPHRTDVDEALRLLTAAYQHAPAKVVPVIAHPYLGAWAHRCLRLLGRVAGTAGLLHADLPYLGAVAVAAAARAGLDAEVTIPTRAGTIALPTLGTAYGLGRGPARIRVGAEAIEIASATARVQVPAPVTAETPGWAPRCEIDLEGLRLAVEDSDPYRDCYPWRPRGRLDRTELARTARVLTDAWRLIQRDHPAHAAAIGAALRSVVPVASPVSGRSVSAASRLAYGSVAICVPEDPAIAALLLLHEFQHMKLGGLLDLLALHRAGGTARHLAPWRADPRPVGALLQGTYAHLAVADFWRQRRRTGPDRRLAEFEFAYWHAQTVRAADALARSGELTPDGADFVRTLRTTLDGWTAEPTRDAVAAGVRAVVDAAVIRWRLANARPDETVVARLRDRWLRGEPPGRVPPSKVRPAAAAPAVLAGLSGRIRESLVHPELVAAEPGSPAERSFLDGDFTSSVAHYRASLLVSDVDTEGEADEAWTGLVLAMVAAGDPAATALQAAPELVRALHTALRPPASGDGRAPDAAPDPGQLAIWLSTAFPSSDHPAG